ncbi:BAG family molecular chaperone regulator 2-like isoform X4 [Dreissena polymorpha]|uniref:BAG family molecular chaperone regulator 2-like isoform X4 n=1 Tax=Dreissena polymorpha TaxID=45954 RepID=UPI002264594D|nr:BAG family molecular chaperone regulator 2-like isoform X4 [Dreissena polymorpha]
MADSYDKENNLQKVLLSVEKRVESLREKAHEIQSEKENLLSMLQDLQDNLSLQNIPEGFREDLEFHTERLIIRCLTVDVSVSIPRDESQENAYKNVNSILQDLAQKCKHDPHSHFEVLESYLNASLADPVSSHVDSRFQSKLLGCGLDDQKFFRKKLEQLHISTKTKIHHSSSHSASLSKSVVYDKVSAQGTGANTQNGNDKVSGTTRDTHIRQDVKNEPDNAQPLHNETNSSAWEHTADSVVRENWHCHDVNYQSCSDGIRVNGDDNDIRVYGDSDGTRVNVDDDGIRVNGNDNDIRVYGDSDGTRVNVDDDGIRVNGNDNDIRVYGDSDGTRVNVDDDGIRVNGDSVFFHL